MCAFVFHSSQMPHARDPAWCRNTLSLASLSEGFTCISSTTHWRHKCCAISDYINYTRLKVTWPNHSFLNKLVTNSSCVGNRMHLYSQWNHHQHDFLHRNHGLALLLSAIGKSLIDLAGSAGSTLCHSVCWHDWMKSGCDRGMVHAVICQVLFGSACHFSNSFHRGFPRWLSVTSHPVHQFISSHREKDTSISCLLLDYRRSVFHISVLSDITPTSTYYIWMDCSFYSVIFHLLPGRKSLVAWKYSIFLYTGVGHYVLEWLM